MKKSILYTLIILSLSFVFHSCDETDDVLNPDYTPISYIKVDGVYYKLSQAFFSVQSYDGTNSLTLLGDNISYDTFFEEFEGSGYGVVIQLKTASSSSQLPMANYVYSEQLTEPNYYRSFKFTFYRDWAFGMTYFNEDVNHNAISVIKSGEVYIITFNGKDNYDNPYELKYIGKVTSIN